MKKAAKLIEERQKIDKKIEDIQKRCPHFFKSIKSTRERLDSSTTIIRWVCNECSQIVGIPNPKEIKKYLNG